MQIGGYIDSNGDVFGNFDANAPWKSDEIANTTAANGDVQAAVLAAIDAVQKPPHISGDAIPVVVFVVVVVIFSITAPFLWGPWLFRKIAGTPGPIKGGLPGTAVIQSIADTGVTVSMPGVGPDAPDYKLGLQVTPDGGGATYSVEVKALIPRIFTPMIMPGANIRVLIDPKDPMKVVPDWQNLSAGAPAGGAPLGGTSTAGATANYGAWAGATAGSAGAAVAAGSTSEGGMDLNFDAQGIPNMSQVSAIAGAVHSGALPSQTGSAAQTSLPARTEPRP